MDTLSSWVRGILGILIISAMIVSSFVMNGLKSAGDSGSLKNNIIAIGLSTVIALGIAILGILAGLAKTWPTALMWGTACFAFGAVLGLIFGIPPYVDAKPTANSNQNAPVRKAQSDLENAKKADASAQDASKIAQAAKQTGAKEGATTQAVLDAKAKNAEEAAVATKSNLTTAQASLDSSQKESEKHADGEDTQGKTPLYGVNSNLTDISDWLTKIIVGVGLVQLGQIKGQLKVAATFVAKGLGPPGDVDSNAPIALGIILYFSVLGFLSSYLLTRVWLPLLLNTIAKA